MDGSKEYHPGETLKLHLQTDSPALVALGAVDTALYAVGGRSHKPLDMDKVCQDPLPSSPAPLWLTLLLPQALGPAPASCEGSPWASPSFLSGLAPWSLFPHSLYLSHLSCS